MKGRIEQVLLILLTGSAVVIAGAIVRRDFFSPNGPRIVSRTAEAPKFIEDWRRILDVGVEIGTRTAPVKLLEFSDLECSFCRRFHQLTLPLVRREFGDSVSLVFIHFPLPNHRFAEPAAKAAECAGAQSAFGAYVEAIFAKQDSLGLRSWTAWAVDAGVQDTARYNTCLKGDAGKARIASGKEMALKLGVRGTPGIMVNG